MFSGVCPLVYQVEDFFGDYSRFAGDRAGEDELEAVAGVDGGFLGGVEGHGYLRLFLRGIRVGWASEREIYACNFTEV